MQEYNELLKNIEALNVQKRIYSTLKELGICRRLAQYFAVPVISSGYSMGEEVIIYVGNTYIATEDARKYYKGDFKGRENHGRIFVRFTKVDLKKYLEAWQTLDKADKEYKGYCETLSGRPCPAAPASDPFTWSAYQAKDKAAAVRQEAANEIDNLFKKHFVASESYVNKQTGLGNCIFIFA